MLLQPTCHAEGCSQSDFFGHVCQDVQKILIGCRPFATAEGRHLSTFITF
jgi:hypothetical protein